jgi:hypothetical protein
MPELVIYSRQGCHLCEVLIEEAMPLLRGRAKLLVRDIDTRADWRAAYDVRIPVVELDGVLLCQYTLDREKLLDALSGLAEQG